ncbi:DUF2500 domain-containing protein [Lysinibacillus sp. NPDC097287]|uniref:DUF2500 domain-containing protein n=1 Tax=Lysinibacillus sp. NPDC097287 TaxID=3364144 RepID=UPI0038242245
MFVIISNLKEWSKNNASPVLTVPAKVVTKRTRTSGGAGDSSASTTYYITFEVQSGDRMELRVSGREYGQLAEGDFGLLTFQGTWFQTFERQKRRAAINFALSFLYTLMQLQLLKIVQPFSRFLNQQR